MSAIVETGVHGIEVSANRPDFDARALFPQFAHRLIAVVLDLIVVLLAVEVLRVDGLARIGIVIADNRPLLIVVALLYFTASWASPLRATPMQFLFGMRVVDFYAEALGLARSAARAALLILLIVAGWAMFIEPSNPYVITVSVVAYLLLYRAAVSVKRQAGHDLPVRSLVLRSAALKKPRLVRQLNDLVSRHVDVPPARLRPSRVQAFAEGVVLAALLFFMHTAMLATYDRELRARIAYALSATTGLKAAVSEYHEEYGRLPTAAAELGFGERTAFPDGGYYELEDDGIIRIRFTVNPELTPVSIEWRPIIAAGGLEWQCRAEGDILPGRLPAMCRD